MLISVVWLEMDDTVLGVDTFAWKGNVGLVNCGDTYHKKNFI